MTNGVRFASAYLCVFCQNNASNPQTLPRLAATRGKRSDWDRAAQQEMEDGGQYDIREYSTEVVFLPGFSPGTQQQIGPLAAWQTEIDSSPRSSTGFSAGATPIYHLPSTSWKYLSALWHQFTFMLMTLSTQCPLSLLLLYPPVPSLLLTLTSP